MRGLVFGRLSIAAILLVCASQVGAECAELLRYQHTELRSDGVVNFCERYAGKVLLVVNTASRCGYTPQFKGLEALYQRYRDRGLEIVGFPSNDFRQEYADAEKTATLCYVNYGVSFTMLSSSAVSGTAANPFFIHLQGQGAEPPEWNFYKFLIDRDGQFTTSFPSSVTPESPAITDLIDALLERP